MRLPLQFVWWGVAEVRRPWFKRRAYGGALMGVYRWAYFLGPLEIRRLANTAKDR